MPQLRKTWIGRPRTRQSFRARLLFEAPTTFFGNLALQDWAVLSLNAFLCSKAFFALRLPNAQSIREQMLALLALALFTLVCVRGELFDVGPVRAAVYRLGMLGSWLGSYLALRALLPALDPQLLDGQLLAIDVKLFGATPAVWLDQFVNRSSVEWFAFFYYSYYWLLGSYVIGSLLFDTGRRRYELLLGAVLVAAVGHAGYTFVPGAGPWAYDGLHLPHALVGGPWWSRVLAAVSSAGAQLDIFPSLHTAFSLLVGLHTFRYRHELPMRWTWLPTWLAIPNILVATVFLRWHYGIDLLAGALLAFMAHRAAIVAWRWEGQRETERQVQAVWEPVLPIAVAGPDRILIVGIFSIQIAVLTLLLNWP